MESSVSFLLRPKAPYVANDRTRIPFVGATAATATAATAIAAAPAATATAAAAAVQTISISRRMKDESD